MTIQAITCDLEGTLVNLERAHHLGHLAAARELGLRLTLSEARQRIPSFVGGPDRAVAAELLAESGSHMLVDDVLLRTRLHYERLRASLSIRSRTGAAAVLNQARKRGLPLALGSVTYRADGEELLRKTRLYRFFEPRHCVFLEDVSSLKPAPDVYLETARRLDVDPSEQLVFEDSPLGVSAAVAAGSPAVAVTALRGKDLRRRLESAGSLRVFPTWGLVRLSELLDLASRTALTATRG